MYNIDRIIYLDAGFISAIFEKKTGESPPTQLTWVEGMKAGAKVPFFSAEVHTQETRTFSVSAQKMLQAVSDSLSTYPSFNPECFEHHP